MSYSLVALDEGCASGGGGVKICEEGRFAVAALGAERFLFGLRSGQHSTVTVLNGKRYCGCSGRTVGGGLGLPSESSTFVEVRFASCSRRKARSKRNLSMPRFMRCSRTIEAALASSTSFIRCFNWMHFLLYDSSTEGGSEGGMGPNTC